MTNPTPSELEHTRVVVRTVLEELGMDMTTAESRNEARKDFLFLREWRTSCDGARNFVVRSAIVTIVAGILGALWLGFKDILMTK